MFILIEFDKVYKELPKDWFDSGKLKWEPNIQLEEGLKKTIPYFAELVRTGCT